MRRVIDRFKLVLGWKQKVDDFSIIKEAAVSFDDKNVPLTKPVDDVLHEHWLEVTLGHNFWAPVGKTYERQQEAKKHLVNYLYEDLHRFLNAAERHIYDGDRRGALLAIEQLRAYITEPAE